MNLKPSLKNIKPVNVNVEHPLKATTRWEGPQWALRSARPLKIALVNPPSIISRYSVSAALVAPLGLAYLASAIKQAGHRVQVVDAIGENTRESLPYSKNLVFRGLSFESTVSLIDRDVDVIGISCMFSTQWPYNKILIRKIKETFPNIPIIAGGEHITAMPEFNLLTCPDINFCVLGEGEGALIELLHALANGGSVDTLAGIAYQKDGKIVVRPPQGRIDNIDDIPWPNWDLIPIENYLDSKLGLGVNIGRAMPMIATRGCPFQCTFCSSPFMWTTRWIARDPQKVIDEIEYYKRRYGVQDIQFYDLTAIIKREWIVAFAEGLITRNLNITWQLPIGTRSEAVDAQVADSLYRSGCTNMNYAPESGSPATLKRIKKMVKLDNMKQSMRGCVKRGLNVKANIILGFPGQTHWEVWETMKFVLEVSWIGIYDMSFFPFSPYPGSELFNDLKKEGQLPELHDDWFLSLSYAEFGGYKSYSKHIGPRMLHFYQLFGFFLFYASQYIFRPWRFLNTIYNLLTGRQESKGEQTLVAMVNRIFLRTG